MSVARGLRLPRGFWWSVAAYAAVTAWHGRDSVRNLFATIVHDAGDPLFSATLLAWNATRLPYTEAWWSLPIFTPVANTTAFSEHMLGLAPISAPLYWLTGNAVAAYNITTLLTFPLSGAAMFLLVHRLTASAPASFLAGLAFVCAPYRVSHLPHLQILAIFWTPLALLGLHAYVETGRLGWLALYAVAWLLQGASNLYYLVFTSLLIGFWTLWFIVFRRRWQALWRVAAVTAIAALPLLPIVVRYGAVHQWYGFSRSLPEVVFFSADIAAVMCAPALLGIWGSMRSACHFEGELFPGVTLPLICVGSILYLWRSSVELPRHRLMRAIVWAAAMVSLVYLATAVSVAWRGRWLFEVGPLRITASSFLKPFSVALWAVAAAFALTALFGRVRASSTGWFYGVTAVLAWLLALGPIPRYLQQPAFEFAPYSWLMRLPGVDGLRVPARFWIVTVTCLAVLSGLLMSAVLARAGARVRVALVVLLSVGIVADGWARYPAVEVPSMLWRERLAGSTVLELPIAEVDTAAGFRAVEGGWRTVNGYSGYHPPPYEVLRSAARAEDGAVLPYLASSANANVVVEKHAVRLVEMLASHADARLVAETATHRLYEVPQRSIRADAAARIDARSASASCSNDLAHVVIDGTADLEWDCGLQSSDAHLLVDLGGSHRVAALRLVGGRRPMDHPRALVIETSIDGRTWIPAWSGGPAGLVFQAAIRQPRYPAIVLPFAPREAQYVRLTQNGRDPAAHWAVSEVEVHGTAAAR